MIANTPRGKVQGIDKAGVLQFRGIRFATAERFRPPVAVEGWDGVLEATGFGPIAPQNPSPLETMLGAGEMASGEDCLSLNVYTSSLDGARPVMVWIHGGGFTAGAGSTPWYAGNNLASKGDVVVVTINYRLGAFGFMHLDAFPGSGNSGILDQVAALEWVRDNISAFGGDPGNVTIFGESAGGMSVGTLLGTPAARGLFHHAVPQSGAANNIATIDSAQRVTDEMLRQLGLRHDQQEALLDLDVAAILQAQQTVGTELLSGGNMFLPFCPVADGVVLTEQPLAAVRGGAAADVDVLIGTTADEWNLFHVLRREPGGMTDEQLHRRVARVITDTRADEVIDVYRTARPGATNDDIFCAIGTDMVFRIPAIRLAEAQATHRDTTRMYLLDYKSSAFDGALGACHAIDIPFVFDNVDRGGVQMLLGGVDDQARELAAATSRAWTTFARTGSPEHDGLPPWPTYSPGRRAVMELGRTRAVLHDPGAAERLLWETL